MMRTADDRGFRWVWTVTATLAVGLGLLSLTGCASKTVFVPGYPHGYPQGSSQQDAALSNGYGLLFDLVAKQSRVGAVLFIKPASQEVVDLIRSIAEASSDAQKKLEQFAKEDPNLILNQLGLPGIEKATRDAIESATADNLIWSGGRFELDLLLTQYEATKYGAFLAQQVVELEEQDHRRQWLKQFSELYRDLHKRVVERLTVEQTQPTVREK